MARLRLHTVALAACIVVSACVTPGAGPNVPRPQASVEVVTPTTAALAETAVTSTASQPPTECEAVACLVYRLVASASWSDGTPVTGEDLAATLDTLEGDLYDSIGRVIVVDDRTVRVEFGSEPGPWQSLLPRVLPATDVDLDLRTMPTNGAFRFVEWVPGDRIVVARDEDHWSDREPITGQPWGDVREIRFVFFDDPFDMIQALDDGDVDVVISRADERSVAAAQDVESSIHAVTPGSLWEHIDFHHEDPLVGQAWVRQVISISIDREKLLDRTVRAVDPDASALDSSQWLTNDSSYLASHADVFDPQRAVEVMQDRFCELVDDVYECQGRRMSFFVAMTNDDPARVEAFESMAEDLAEVGIELVPLYRPRSVFLSPEFLFADHEVWQMIMFSWRARSDPQSTRGTLECQGILNVNRYCNPMVDQFLDRASKTTDQSERLKLIAMADELYLSEWAIIPLYQRPELLAWSRILLGPVPNVSPSTDLWNVGTWVGKPSITVAIEGEPSHLDPSRTDDDAANIVMSTLMYGAFGMTPDFRNVPVLVETVEVVEGSAR